MMKALPFLCYPALGILAGWASISAAGRGKKEEKTATADTPAPRQREARDTRPPMEPDAIFTLIRRQMEEGKEVSSGSISPLIEGWTDAQLVNALDEAAKEPEALLRFSSMAGTLFREYAKRDMHAAAEWMLGQPDALRLKFAPMWASMQPDERAPEVLAFIRAHRDLFTDPFSAHEAAMKSVRIAAKQGPRAFIDQLRQSLQEGMVGNVTIDLNLPAGFDYGGLLSSPDFHALGIRGVEGSIMESWRKRDKEAAFSWALENQGGKALANIYRPRIDESPDSVRWFVGKLESLTPEEQDGYFRNAVWSYASRDMNFRRWTENASPALRDKMAATGAKALFISYENRATSAVAAMEALPEVEARLRLLESQQADPDWNPGVVKPLPEQEATVLREALASWNTEPARAEAILKRYTTLPPAKP